MTLSELVQQVYYTQEKVLLDFEPFDDKFREVIAELRLVLQELQKEEDWLFLRERLVLGPIGDLGMGTIPEFRLPDWVYKPSGLHDDGVRLHAVDHCGRIREDDYLHVPWAAAGESVHPHTSWYDMDGGYGMADPAVEAVCIGRIVTFNRKIPRDLSNRVAVTDVQREIKMPDIPPRHDEFSKLDAKSQERLLDAYTKDAWFSEIPDPNYLVFRVAALHCVGSPVAQMRQQDLVDSAQKLLSAMREANSMATRPSRVEWSRLGYVDVI